MILETTINGVKKEIKIKANEVLLDVLRREGYQGVKEGCREGQCGACTVLLDDTPVCSCHLPALRAQGKRIMTVEGLAEGGELHPLQKAFLEEGAVQCGFCTPGMLLSSWTLLQRNPEPTEEEIKKALDGHLCRCTGYVNIIKAVKKASRMLQKGQKR
jgi:carbon-monoxide dehydrogenase small subunit